MSKRTNKPKNEPQPVSDTGYFILDPHYRHFVPGKTYLKKRTLGYEDFGELGCMGWAFVAIFAIIVIPSILLLFSAIVKFVFVINGVETQAVINDCQIVENSMDDTHLLITYIYILKDSHYTNYHEIYKDGIDCNNYPIGMTFRIKYLRIRPQVSEVIDNTLYPMGLIEVLFFTCLIIFMLYFFGFPIISYMRVIWKNRIAKRKQLRLQKNSILLTGEIRQIKKYGEYDICHIDVTFEFETPNGQVLHGKQSNRRDDLKDVESPSIGTPVKVLYADKNAFVML